VADSFGIHHPESLYPTSIQTFSLMQNDPCKPEVNTSSKVQVRSVHGCKKTSEFSTHPRVSCRAYHSTLQDILDSDAFPRCRLRDPISPNVEFKVIVDRAQWHTAVDIFITR
jgi:hypothetical protein